ncbi:MAG: type III pantothenate kinase [Christensenella sp.]|uniref:type III pantothenate kinase n=1 Tax=Christensenella sp. TaxID=1935934 RepID=UPI002B21E424|nr:type III pantothenate kinase [Christensenella sp.]MEA5001956.1 type III pantothenate kinase [Christensenella sp.]
MIFALDVGNTNIKCGMFEDSVLIHSFRMATDIEATSDQFGIRMIDFFRYLGHVPRDIDGVIISSVIPSINYTLDHMVREYFEKKPMFVGPGIKTGINIKYDNPKELGTDRIVNAVGAYELFGGPVITIDFGTATSFGAISENGDFLGGAICPGIKITSEALTINTARLPRIELMRPDKIINKSTVTAMQAGIIYGYVGQVQYIVGKMKAEMGGAKVVATGGFSELIAAETDCIDEIIPTLTLIGLNKIYMKNC